MEINATAMLQARNQPVQAPRDLPTAGMFPKGVIDRSSKLYKAAQDFESLFVKQMLSSMKQTVHKEGFMNGGMGEEVFEDMLYDQYSKDMTKSASFGLADSLYRQLQFLDTLPKMEA